MSPNPAMKLNNPPSFIEFSIAFKTATNTAPVVHLVKFTEEEAADPLQMASSGRRRILKVDKKSNLTFGSNVSESGSFNLHFFWILELDRIKALFKMHLGITVPLPAILLLVSGNIIRDTMKTKTPAMAKNQKIALQFQISINIEPINAPKACPRKVIAPDNKTNPPLFALVVKSPTTPEAMGTEEEIQPDCIHLRINNAV
ncbi:hypothetical protein WICPIJ_007106 [Wickerhamomyces pijperi]|uniref:Uncharacterized protein n=1 Tax=Wickerhamomyces pijperi TaxID=599730 RepID=A0A9P8Q377_WICPI|nr:hypothetical protein WICPIJ_007106 [Wickerhamomyces pijperi]